MKKRTELAVLFLFLPLVLWVGYGPSLDGDFLWDDDGHLTRPELRGAEGLSQIWFEPGATQQYYPLLHTVFWCLGKVFHDVPIGYRVMNLILHGVCCFLVFLILSRLSFEGALLAAGLFALHPVHVESTAWISEMKNTLSGVWYLLAMLAWLRFDQDRHRGLWVLSLFLFFLALATKTVTVTLPCALLLIVWWKRGRVELRLDIMHLLPFFILGVVAGIHTAWVETHFIGASGTDFELTVLQRVLLAGRVPWMSIFHLVWPVQLPFFVQNPPLDPSSVVEWFFPIATLAVPWMLWMFRRRMGRGPLVAWLFFVGTLFPALGFIDVYPFRYSFFADHFQYLASLGILTLVAGSVQRIGFLPPAYRPALGLVLLLPLLLLSRSRSLLFQGNETLWRHTLEQNPTSFIAANHLGMIERSRGQLNAAIELFRTAADLKPDHAESRLNLGTCLRDLNRPDEAMQVYEDVLEIHSDYPPALANIGQLHFDAGRFEESVTACRRAVRGKPELVDAWFNLSAGLAQLGRFEEAIKACDGALGGDFRYASTHPSRIHRQIGVIHVLSGQGRASIPAYERAVALDPDFGMAWFELSDQLGRAGRGEEAKVAGRRASELLRRSE